MIDSTLPSATEKNRYIIQSIAVPYNRLAICKMDNNILSVSSNYSGLCIIYIHLQAVFRIAHFVHMPQPISSMLLPVIAIYPVSSHRPLLS